MDCLNKLSSTAIVFSLFVLVSTQQVQASWWWPFGSSNVEQGNTNSMDRVRIAHLVEAITGDDDRDNVELFLSVSIPNCRQEVELKDKKADEKREKVWAELVAAHEYSRHECKKGTAECEQAMQNVSKLITLYYSRSDQVHSIATNHAPINAAEAKANKMRDKYDAQKNQLVNPIQNIKEKGLVEEVKALSDGEEKKEKESKEL